jgi:hypothetical protein
MLTYQILASNNYALFHLGVRPDLLLLRNLYKSECMYVCVYVPA